MHVDAVVVRFEQLHRAFFRFGIVALAVAVRTVHMTRRMLFVLFGQDLLSDFLVAVLPRARQAS